MGTDAAWIATPAPSWRTPVATATATVSATPAIHVRETRRATRMAMGGVRSNLSGAR